MMERIALARRIGVDRPLGPGIGARAVRRNDQAAGARHGQRINDDVKAQARLLKDHDREMLRKLSRAIKVQPSIDLLEARAVIYYRQGEINKALDDLNTILSALPRRLNGTLFSRSHVYESEKQYAKAIEDLRRLRARANELPREHCATKVALRWAPACCGMQKMKEAATEFDEALQLARNSLNAVLGRLQAAARAWNAGSGSERALSKRAITTWPDLRVFDPLVAAAGLVRTCSQSIETAVDCGQPPPCASGQATSAKSLRIRPFDLLRDFRVRKRLYCGEACGLSAATSFYCSGTRSIGYSGRRSDANCRLKQAYRYPVRPRWCNCCCARSRSCRCSAAACRVAKGISVASKHAADDPQSKVLTADEWRRLDASIDRALDWLAHAAKARRLVSDARARPAGRHQPLRAGVHGSWSQRRAKANMGGNWIARPTTSSPARSRTASSRGLVPKDRGSRPTWPTKLASRPRTTMRSAR